MRLLAITRGSAGCGKSSFIREKGLEPYTLSPDNIRLMMQSPVLDEEGKLGITHKNEKKVWQLLFKMLEERMQRGEFIVVDATHSKMENIQVYKALITKYRYRMVCIDFTDIPMQETIRRNLNREEYKTVPAKAIQKMYSRFEQQKELPSWFQVVNHKDWDKYFNYHQEDVSHYNKIHFIGDLQGCYTVLKEYLTDGLKDDELYVFVGDICDRGIENARVLNFMLSIFNKPNVIIIEGNHECLSKDTEVLTDNGWKFVDEVTVDNKIAQYDLNTKEIVFDFPIKTINNFSEEMILIESNNIKQKVTLNHEVIFKNNKIKAIDLFNSVNLLDVKLKQLDFPLFGECVVKRAGINLTSDMIRLLTWVIMDGTIVKRQISNTRIQFKLSKERKIKELRNLLDKIGIKYTFREATKSSTNKLQPYYICIYSDDARMINSYLEKGKSIPVNWSDFNKDQVNVFLETLSITDGAIHGNAIKWRTIEKSHVDIVQEMCIRNGISFKFSTKKNPSGFQNGKTQYECSIFSDGLYNADIIIEKIQYNDKVYCFEMPKGTLVTRLDGKIGITGNCHLWKWANNEKAWSSEFELNTKPQLEKEGVSKKDVRRLYRKLYQACLFKYHDKRILVTHAGLSTLPTNLLTVSTEQLIGGVGGYQTDIDKIFSDKIINNEKFDKLVTLDYKPLKTFQIHGHRNKGDVPINASIRSFNLEGQVEFGGHLRIVTLDGNGFQFHEVKNNVFHEKYQKHQIVNSNVVVDKANFDLIDKLKDMKDQKLIKENKFGDISSFNFTSKAFWDKNWNDVTIKARGLFVNTVTGEIVAKGYEKFFNINEMPFTSMDALKKTLQFPVKVYGKLNGFLGIVGYDSSTDRLLLCSKSMIEGTENSLYADYFRDLFDKTFTAEQQEFIKDFVKKNNVSLTFEVIDIENDPHIIEYDHSHLVLLDIIDRTAEFKKREYQFVQYLSDKLKVKRKLYHKYIADWQAFEQFYRDVSIDSSLALEGFVIEDQSGFMTKLKLPYYNYWKLMRTIKDRIVSGKEIPYMSADKRVFIDFCKSLDKEVLQSMDIITLRNTVLTSDRNNDIIRKSSLRNGD